MCATKTAQHGSAEREQQNSDWKQKHTHTRAKASIHIHANVKIKFHLCICMCVNGCTPHARRFTMAVTYTQCVPQMRLKKIRLSGWADKKQASMHTQIRIRFHKTSKYIVVRFGYFYGLPPSKSCKKSYYKLKSEIAEQQSFDMTFNVVKVFKAKFVFYDINGIHLWHVIHHSYCQTAQS